VFLQYDLLLFLM